MNKLYSRVEIFKKLTKSTWSASSEVITDAAKIVVREGIGKIKDTFSFRIINANNNLYRTYHSGNGSATQFNLRHYPIGKGASTRLVMEAVYIDGTLMSADNPAEYTINNTTGVITFTSAPAAGTNNIEVRYNVVDTDDKIKIWMWRNNTWGGMNQTQQDNALVIQGTVTNPLEQIDGSGGVLTVQGKSWMETLFTTPIVCDVVPDTISSLEIIRDNVLPRVHDFNENRKVLWHPSNPTTKKSDGTTDLPKPGYVQVYKSAMECIEELTSDNFTKDGNYIYYIVIGDGNNGTVAGTLYLRVRAKDTSTPDVTLTSGIEPTNISIGRTSDDVVNVIIYYAGKDVYGHGITYIYYDSTSLSTGGKWKYIPMGTIAEELMNLEFTANTASFNDNGEDPPAPTDDRFPISYNYTMLFNLRTGNTFGNHAETSNAYITSSDDEYNTAIRSEAKWQGFDRAAALMAFYLKPEIKGSVTVTRPDEGTYTKGDLVEVTIDRYNLPDDRSDTNVNSYIRLHGIMHTIWSQTLTLDEDPELSDANPKYPQITVS